MKKIRILELLQLFIVLGFGNYLAHAQTPPPQIVYSYPSRTQQIGQYTDIFISSPVTGQMLGAVNDYPTGGSNTVNRYFEFNSSTGAYVQIPYLDAQTTAMVPGKGYVLQRGGIGYATIGLANITSCVQTYSGSANTSGTYTFGANQYALVGNPFSNFLDADQFLLDATNESVVKGPIMLWAHNTIVSPANINPNDPNAFRFSANDFALYNVLGGVAAGRSYSTSAENETFTGVPIPNGKLGFGTGFLIRATGAGGTAVFTSDMSTSSNGGENQSFRMNTSEKSETEREGSNVNPSTATTVAVPDRHRIWINLEQGVPPGTGVNLNPLKQALIGYAATTDATAGDSDRVYDAEVVNGISNPLIEIYSLAASSTKHLAIQGRNASTFADTEEFKLGVKATQAGTYTFTTTADGMFGSTPYYISDYGMISTFPYTCRILPNEVNTALTNRFKVIFKLSTLSNPKIQLPQCGHTLSTIDELIFTNQPTIKYHVMVMTNDSTPVLVTQFDVEQTNYPGAATNGFSLNRLGIEFGHTYQVFLASTFVNNAWQYGDPCLITMPASPPTRTLNTCTNNLPATANNTWNPFFTNNSSMLGIAVSRYKFTATVGGSPFGTPFVTTNNSFTLHSFGAAISPNTTYSITVEIEWNNAWQGAGAPCTITTSSVIPRLAASNDGEFDAKAFPNPYTNNFKLDLKIWNDLSIEVKVYDMLGRQIETRTIEAENVSSEEIGEGYKSGVYNIVLKQGENVKILRVLKT